jgi:PPM family protein phosphatase
MKEMKQGREDRYSRFLIATAKGARDEQQDAAVCLSDPDQGRALLVVSDGVGGNTGGSLASRCAVESARVLWEDRQDQFREPESGLAALCQQAHQRIREEGEKELSSARATIVALFLTETEAFWVHCGDSRMYHFRKRELLGRTEDHSIVQILVNQGKLSEEEMGSHPSQGILLQCLGGDEYPSPTFGYTRITPQDAFLLCTDGFWERTSTKEMAETLFCPAQKAALILDRTVACAVERNGPKGDNVTAAVALPGSAATADPARLGRNRRLISLLILILIVLLAVLVLLHWHP